MKVHVFISVLVFHVVVIAGLYLLSACSSSSNETSSLDGQRVSTTGGSIHDRYAEPNRPVEDDNLVVSPVVQPETNRGIDPAFNSGSQTYGNSSPSSPAGRFEPRRPSDNLYGVQPTPTLNEFNENEVLEPIRSDIPVTSSVEYVVKKGDSLWKISREFGVSLKTLLQANGLNEKSTIQAGQSLTIPSSTERPTGFETSPSGGSTSEIHVVAKGDTLSRIARQYNTTVNDLKAANGLPTNIIQLGQRLVIPVNGLTSSGNSPGSSAPVASPRVAPVTSPRVTPVTPPAVNDAEDADIVHVVKSGETPGAIAKQYGITTSQLMKDNNIADARRMVVGQQLKIRLGIAQPATPPPASSTSRPVNPTPVETPTLFDESVFDDLDDIPEVEVIPRS